MNRIKRLNMVTRHGESWRPPLFSASKTLVSRLILVLRRLFDLQTASIWRDLSSELAEAKGTVVDAGCGAQPYRSLFQSKVKYIGIDTADAKAHFGYSLPDIRYFNGNVWPLEDGSVDLVLCTETLEHVLNTHGFLMEAARCLVPGGRIVLTVPFSARWHYIPYDYWRFTPSSLEYLLKGTGFAEISVYARGNELTVACYKANALILGLLMPQGKGFFTTFGLRLLSLPLLPLFFLLTFTGSLSLRGRGGDDCLGYTVVAAKAGGPGA
jgi:SAM-dependent methyltransferase